MISFSHISVDDIEPNEWNPQEQDEATLAELVDTIKKVGFIDPIEVIPLAGGKYRILGGEHRWTAARTLGMKTIPAVVLTDKIWQDEDLQKFHTVKLNILRGKLNSEKFLKLYGELGEKYGKESLQKLFGFTDVKTLDRLVGSAKKALKKALPKALQDEFDDKTKNVKSADDLSKIVQTLLLKYGDTVNNDYIIFAFGKREHIYLPVDRNNYERVAALAEHAYNTGTSLNELITPILEQAVEALPKSKKKKGSPQKPSNEDDISY